jgi:hypothetical protein
MTMPDPNRREPVDFRKRAAAPPVGLPQPSGYPPMPESPYPTALVPEYPAAFAHPTAQYPAAQYPAAGNASGYWQAFPPAYQAPRNGLGTSALVLGIVSVVFSWTLYLGFILGVLAICFGAVGLGRVRRGEATNGGSARAGLVLGIVAVALLALLVVVGIGFLVAVA